MKFRLLISSIILALIPISVGAASVVPSVLEISGARGDVLHEKITVINTRDIEQTYYLGVLKFEPQENGEGPKFIPFEDDNSGLAQWIQLFSTEVRVPANTKGEIPFDVSIPSDVLSGGYYAALTVSQSPSELVADNGAMVEAKTAALILLTVEGDTREKLSLLDFRKDSARLSSRIDGKYDFRLQNQGNVHVSPKGIIQVKDIFGRIVAKLDANPSLGRVLPNSTRTYVVGSEETKNYYQSAKDQMKVLAFGPMTAELLLKYGQSEQTITSSVSFWYFPWQIMSLDVLLILVILFIYSLAHRRK
ncbi:hypothetical protein HYV69_01025 [Candidatus Uhrbacteria bacterium]|nr:hypothetical protein [Candidatus Uhrbacteria bacterium]